MNMMKYDAGTGELKNWLIQENAFDERYLGKCEAIFAQGNGYLGVRNALEEAYTGEVRNTFVTGTFNKASREEVTELPNAADMTGMTIMIDGHKINLSQGELKAYKRTMNLKNGEVIREFTWTSPSGVTINARFQRIVSLADEHVMAAALCLSVDKDAAVSIETGIDGSVTNSGSQHFKDLKRRIYEARDMQYLAKTTESGVWFAQHAACSLDAEAEVLPIMGRRTLMNKFSFKVPAGQSIHFEKISILHTSRDKVYEGMDAENITETLKKDGMTALKAAFAKGYEVLKQESENKWKEYWKESDILIEGDADFDQLAVRFALYHLNIMVKHDDNRVGIGAKALTGEGYKGHSFWDTEMFILPYFTFTRPQTARTLLEYRYRNLFGAHLKARECGYEGAMYPWECAWVDDGEVTPLYIGADVVTGKLTKCWTGIIEHHISADIAYAVEQYYLITGDKEFMKNYGYEIILDTALFWASRLQYNAEKDRYEILDVIGPDEYKEHVDNNTYTNYMAANNMSQALKIIAQLSEEDSESYRKLDEKLDLSYIKEKIEACIDKIYLPIPNEDKTLHDSSLSKSTHAILANDLGLEKMAYDLYEGALTIDLGTQMKSSNEGIHSASAGGIWESTVMGFGGVRMEGEHMRIAPKLPEKWNRLIFPLCFKGNSFIVKADHKSVVVENNGKKDVAILLGKEMVTIAAGQKVKRNL